jgi:hypothetical protein
MKKKFIYTVFLTCSFLIVNAFAQEEILRPKVEYKAQGLKDPFQTEVERAAMPEEGWETPQALPKMTVQGIIWGGIFPQAIVNNTVVKEGDTIAGARVIKINKDRVTVFFSGKQYELISPAAQAVSEKPKEGGKK